MSPWKSVSSTKSKKKKRQANKQRSKYTVWDRPSGCQAWGCHWGVMHILPGLQVSMSSGENQRLREEFSLGLAQLQPPIAPHPPMSAVSPTGSNLVSQNEHWFPVLSGPAGHRLFFFAFLFPADISVSKEIHGQFDRELCFSVGYWISLYLRWFCITV